MQKYFPPDFQLYITEESAYEIVWRKKEDLLDMNQILVIVKNFIILYTCTSN